MNIDTSSDAYRRGYTAFEAGVSDTAAPLSYNSKELREWLRGWHDAHEKKQNKSSDSGDSGSGIDLDVGSASSGRSRADHPFRGHGGAFGGAGASGRWEKSKEDNVGDKDDGSDLIDSGGD